MKKPILKLSILGACAAAAISAFAVLNVFNQPVHASLDIQPNKVGGTIYVVCQGGNRIALNNPGKLPIWVGMNPAVRVNPGQTITIPTPKTVIVHVQGGKLLGFNCPLTGFKCTSGVASPAYKIPCGPSPAIPFLR